MTVPIITPKAVNVCQSMTRPPRRIAGAVSEVYTGAVALLAPVKIDVMLVKDLTFQEIPGG